MKSLNSLLKKAYFANDLSAWVPQIWANECLIVLNERLFAPNLVHRDFENLVSEKGDMVKTRRPNTFTFNRKSDTDDNTFQDLTATNVNVPLDQHLEVTFKVRDIEWSKGLKHMMDTHLSQAAIALARACDQMIFGQAHQFLANGVGGLRMLTDTNAKDYLLYTYERLNNNKVPDGGRNMVLNTNSEIQVLRPEWFTSWDKTNVTAGLREGTIGRAFGFEMMRSNNMSMIIPGNTVTQTGAINLAAGYTAGSTTFVVNGFGAALTVGQWITIDGLPNIVVSSSGATNLVVRWPLTRFVATAAVITAYTPAQINNGAGYAAGYDKEITIDTTTVALQVGQAVTFGTASPSTTAIYSVLKVNGLVGITLDRPLEVAVVDNQSVNIGVPGNFNFAFHKNAIAFVNRPLALPDASLGVQAAVATSPSGISMRLLRQYNAVSGYTQVTLDMLCGVKVLDANLGAVLLG